MFVNKSYWNKNSYSVIKCEENIGITLREYIVIKKIGVEINREFRRRWLLTKETCFLDLQNFMSDVNK